MLEIFKNFLYSIIVSYVCFYSTSRILKVKINHKKIIFWIFLIGYTLFISVIYELISDAYRILINYFLLAVLTKFLFKKSNMNIFIATFITMLLFMVADLIGALLVIVVSNASVEEIKNDYFFTFISNTIVSIIVVILLNIKRITKSFQYSLFETYTKVKKTNVIILFGTVFTLALVIYNIYFDSSPFLEIFINFIIISVYMLLVLTLLKEKNNNFKLQTKYEVLIDNLNEYEKMLDYQRINNHENKNQLAVIKGMLNGKKDKIKVYIDDLLATKINDDEVLLFKTKKLPSGGLQGLIYQKLLMMKELGININFEISKGLNYSRNQEIDEITNRHLCTIIGVELDNAIEAVENLKEKTISISFYNEQEMLIVDISNNFEGILELDKIENKNYSTKGKDRGYGLNLVKEIIDKNDTLFLERQVIGNIFKQKLKIKI